MAKREIKNLEYKADISNTFLKTISAYANYGDGIILFGVDDKGTPHGLEGDLEEICLRIENKINDNLSPVPRYGLTINAKNRTIELKVFEGSYKPYTYKNKAYKRADSATVEVDRVELNHLILEGEHLNYEDLPASNQNLSFKALEKALIEKLRIEQLDKDIFKTLALFSDKKGFNRAAEILADENLYPGLDIVVFGKNINEFMHREKMDQTSILIQYEKAIDMYRKTYQYEQIEGIERKRIEKIPENAFREALANSIVHREWDKRTYIQIGLYEEKIEITSPGGLPYGISKDEYMYGQISILRNPILSNVFFRLGYIEQFGTGIRRINQAYEGSIIKPEYKVYENSITVVLPLFSSDATLLTKDEQQVFALLKKQGELSRLEIQENLSMNKDKAIRVLNELINKNAIEKTGIGRGTKYSLL